jgi:hypothetical protein
VLRTCSKKHIPIGIAKESSFLDKGFAKKSNVESHDKLLFMVSSGSNFKMPIPTALHSLS